MLDYSRISRHLLVTAGDDGSAHLWDTTGRSPKVCSMLMNLLSTCLFQKTKTKKKYQHQCFTEFSWSFGFTFPFGSMEIKSVFPVYLYMENRLSFW